MRAIIFDFDGLILDTESPEFQSWQEIYQEHGCDLSLSVWADCIGTASDVFDPCAHLELQLGCPVDRESLITRHRRRDAELLAGQPALPGVLEYLDDARRLGLKLGVASSSSHQWVDGHLNRLGLWEHFDCVLCREDVRLTKPDPELYLSALRALGVEASEAIALEDSPNGILAARRAGMVAVAVPNRLTRSLNFDGAHLLLPSLAGLSLEELLRWARVHPGGTEGTGRDGTG